MKTLTLVLLTLFMLACASSIPSASIDIPKPAAVIRSLPFDPEKILKSWKPLEIYRFEQPEMAVVVCGNPKIEWTEEKIKFAFDQPIPEGSIAATVSITLFKDPQKGVLLVEFMFVNPLGIIEFYAHDKVTDTFIRQPYYTQKMV
ncbi:MAG: hypothetical protein JRE23_17065 [Deltaproteobacteria bacterium]|nr:hypothetical protein [Deltaproteobacteria bacterium]